jgi:hypothetical protein
MKPSRKRRGIKSTNKRRYRKSIQLREQLRGRLRGIALFERLTGIKAPTGMITNG